ncbi:hypothetical protein GCM10010211_26120 [Streptomyces albospinus]|uniref:Transposase n=1 Tax=Streptomyces albospinus TaxID=285515 RepID=A0ABQ2UZ33_9ACTN|nr:hypothetical protein GCM10010211_26120 [Streptomyces albospinus]
MTEGPAPCGWVLPNVIADVLNFSARREDRRTRRLGGARRFKAQLDLERHGGRTPAGVIVRVLQRILALTAAIWHNYKTGQPTLRSLTAYDH